MDQRDGANNGRIIIDNIDIERVNWIKLICVAMALSNNVTFNEYI